MFAGTPGDAADAVCKGARGHFVSLYVSETGAQGKVDEIDIYDPSDQDAALAWNADDNAFADVVTNVSDVCPESKCAVAAGPAPLAGSGDIFLCVARFGAVIEANQDGADQIGGAVGFFVYSGSHLNRFGNELSSVIFPANALDGDDLESDDSAVWNQVNTVWKKGDLVEISHGNGQCSAPTSYELKNLSEDDNTVCARRGNLLEEMQRRLNGH